MEHDHRDVDAGMRGDQDVEEEILDYDDSSPMDYAKVREMLAGESDEVIMSVVSELPTASAQIKAACLMLSSEADVFGILKPIITLLPEAQWEKKAFEVFEEMPDDAVVAQVRDMVDGDAEVERLLALAPALRKRHLLASLIDANESSAADDDEEEDADADDEDGRNAALFNPSGEAPVTAPVRPRTI